MSNILPQSIYTFVSCAFQPLGCISDYFSTESAETTSNLAQAALNPSINQIPTFSESGKLVSTGLPDLTQWQTAVAIGGCAFVILGGIVIYRSFAAPKTLVESPKTSSPVKAPATPAATKEDPKTIFLRTAESLKGELTTINQKGKLFAMLAAYHLSQDVFEEAKECAKAGKGLKGLQEEIKEDLTILLTRAQTGSSSASVRKRLTYEDPLSPASPTQPSRRRDLPSESKRGDINPKSSGKDSSGKKKVMTEPVEISATKTEKRSGDPNKAPLTSAEQKKSQAPPPPPPPPPSAPQALSQRPAAPANFLAQIRNGTQLNRAENRAEDAPSPPSESKSLVDILKTATVQRRADLSTPPPTPANQKGWDD